MLRFMEAGHLAVVIKLARHKIRMSYNIIIEAKKQHIYLENDKNTQ